MEAASVDLSVLIVDDNEAFANALGRSFRTRGYDTWVVHDLGTAEVLLQELRPEIAVLETQVDARCGLEFLRRMRARGTEAEAVIVTAFPSTSIALQAVRAGARGYLAKPVTAPLVLQALDRQVPEPQPGGPDERSSTLGEAMREYLDQAFTSAGSVSEAARRLGLERRSLRRMLSRDPSAR